MDPAALLPTLIQAAGESPERVLDEVAAALTPLGFRERRLTGPHGAALFVRGAPRIALSGHVDVVPALDGWTHAPHGGHTADARIWGRGACDMLGSVACFVAAAAREPDAPCAIVLTTDEETTMHGAERALAESWLEGLEGIVVGEPTHHAVGVAEKGVLWLRVETRGRAAHGSMPELGDNAADRLLRALPPLLAARPTGKHAMLGAPTMSLNRLGAGEAVNQVPASAFAELDIRYLPGQTAEAIVKDLEAAAARVGEPVRVTVISSHVPFETGPDAPLSVAALAAVAAAGAQPRAVALPYGTEASKFAPAGIPCVILGPGESGLAHTNRESIALSDLEIGAATYAHMLRAFADGGA